MALLKAIPTSQGSVASYWRIAVLNQDRRAQEDSAFIVLHGFVDEAAADAVNPQPLEAISRTLAPRRSLAPGGAPEPGNFSLAQNYPEGLSLAEAYALAKTWPEFAGALDA